MELIIYVGVYFMSFPLSLKHIRDSYRDRTGKMRSFFEVRFMSKQILRVLQPLFPHWSLRTSFLDGPST